MRDRFLSYYEEEQAMGRPAPKVLIKLGALHTQRGTNVLGINDIGDQVQQIAKTRGSRDLNLYFMFRYFADEEEPLGYFDNSDNNSNWVLERKPFTSQGKLLEWTLIDLKALNAFIIQNELYVSPPLKVILKTRDYVLLPPVAHDALPNFRKN